MAIDLEKGLAVFRSRRLNTKQSAIRIVQRS